LHLPFFIQFINFSFHFFIIYDTNLLSLLLFCVWLTNDSISLKTYIHVCWCVYVQEDIGITNNLQFYTLILFLSSCFLSLCSCHICNFNAEWVKIFMIPARSTWKRKLRGTKFSAKSFKLILLQLSIVICIFHPLIPLWGKKFFFDHNICFFVAKNMFCLLKVVWVCRWKFLNVKMNTNNVEWKKKVLKRIAKFCYWLQSS
jgi:hypothetical protein